LPLLAESGIPVQLDRRGHLRELIADVGAGEAGDDTHLHEKLTKVDKKILPAQLTAPKTNWPSDSSAGRVKCPFADSYLGAAACLRCSIRHLLSDALSV
jgi:hypothetical protein